METTKTLLKEALEAFRSMFAQNKSDSPVFSNIGWLIGIMESLISSKTEEEFKIAVKKFQDYHPVFTLKSLTEEDLDGCPLDILKKARDEYRKLKRQIRTVHFSRSLDGSE